MKRLPFIILCFALVLTACAPKAQDAAGDVLKVSDGKTEKNYTAADLKALGEAQADFNGVTYVGVPLTVLLQDAGIDPAALKIVKAVAVDGFSANYESALFAREDTLVAYARADGPLGEDEGSFRMVLPDQEGKLNPRELVEIIAIP
jgi:DMSO/TMAO reductase YedYZ molybdopterin-dependent catalytic subunit